MTSLPETRLLQGGDALVQAVSIMAYLAWT